MKRYFLFSGNNKDPHHPTFPQEKGWEQFKGNFSSIEEATDYFDQVLKKDKFDWAHVVDIDSMEIISHLIGYPSPKEFHGWKRFPTWK